LIVSFQLLNFPKFNLIEKILKPIEIISKNNILCFNVKILNILFGIQMYNVYAF